MCLLYQLRNKICHKASRKINKRFSEINFNFTATGFEVEFNHKIFC